MDNNPPPKKEEEGGAGWIMTFADLMSLLMCFFVLLLSFAELDVMKYKAVAGSLKLAFGVQRDIKAIEVPKGTSIIAQEFSSGKPDPTVVNEIRQKTTDEDKQTLEFTDALVDSEDGQKAEGDLQEQAEQEAEEKAQELMEALKEEVEKGMIEIETDGARVVIRIQEKGSFPSGTARFDKGFGPVVGRLSGALAGIEGEIAVAGHTDNIPIKTKTYRSNWDLSSARAVSVVHALLENDELVPERFVVEGHGESDPLVPNDTAANRALNRRVEIVINQASGAPNISDETLNEIETMLPEQPGSEVLIEKAETKNETGSETVMYGKGNQSRIDKVRNGIMSGG
ncbi:MAG: flagellar motor protein MotB [Pseudomonadota bacterium]